MHKAEDAVTSSSSSALQQDIEALRVLFHKRFATAASSTAVDTQGSSVLLTPDEVQTLNVSFLTAVTQLQVEVTNLAERAEKARKQRETVAGL